MSGPMPDPQVWPECSACGAPYVLRRVLNLSGPQAGQHVWLWQRDCRHTSAARIAGPEADQVEVAKKT